MKHRRDRRLQNLAYLKKPSSRHPVFAVLVFLDLLKSYPDCFRERDLAEAGRLAGCADAPSDDAIHWCRALVARMTGLLHRSTVR